MVSETLLNHFLSLKPYNISKYLGILNPHKIIEIVDEQSTY